MTNKSKRFWINLTAFFRLQGKSIVRTLLLLLTALAITVLLPHKQRIAYPYELNKPWTASDLLAPFDFEITKSEEKLNQEAQQVVAAHLPMYQQDAKMGMEVARRFEQRFQDELPSGIYLLLRREINRAYQRGLVGAGPVHSNGRINIVYDNKKTEAQKHAELWEHTAFADAWKTRVINQPLPQSLTDSLLLFADESLGPNIVYQDDLTRESRESLLATIDPLMGKIKQGQLLIKQGALVTAEHAQQLDALEAISSGSYTPAMRQWLGLLGQVILVGLILSILVCYLFFFRKVLFDDINRMTVILLNLVATVAMYRLAIAYNLPSIYLLPFAVLPMITRALFDAWLAMVICVIATFLCAFFASAPAEFMVLQLTAGMGAVFSLINIRRRYQFYRSSGVVLFVYVLGYVGYTLVQKGDFNALIPLYFGYFGMNAVLTLIASPMLFGYEKLFGFVSDVSLMELSDTNSPLLRRLSLEAPGTFQHTLQVANLAEAAIYEIGGNALLIRVGALYHDIGKLTNPIYFIENQHASVNPHDDLPFEESAQIIIGHVHDGIQLAKEHRLPNMLIDFIRTHHGDQRVEYFYQSQLRDFPDTEIDDLKFRYPGPKPFSKETAVLMMADSVEAASRSLKTPDASSIGGLVDGIIDKQLANKQFINADITLRDIARIKRLFKKMLNSIYHVRVEYPGQKKREE